MRLEKRLDIPRPIGAGERLRDGDESANEESRRRIPPIQLRPILLDECPRQVPPDARPARRDAPDHDWRVLESNRVRQGARDGLSNEGFLSRPREGNE